MKDRSKRIVLVLCTKNEEKNILDVLKSAKKYVDKIIVVDGNSKDKTIEMVKKYKDIDIFYDSGKGKGEAIRIAINKSNINDVLIFMDADGSHLPSDIPLILEEFNKGSDLVIASRGKGGSDELSGDFEKCIRLIGSTIITMIINLRFKSNITDSQNGFRIISAKLAKKINLKENGFSIEQEMLMKMLKNKYKVSEIASHEYARKHGDSNIKLSTETYKYLRSLIRGICF